MFGRIFVGVDAEGEGDRAAVAAARLQRRFGGELHFVHAVPMFWRSWSAPAMAAWEANKKRSLDASRMATAQRIDAALRAADVRLPNVVDLVEVVEDAPAHALLTRAERSDDLIALGGHRHLGMLHFGATARTVLAKSHCPVWVQPADAAAIERITIGVDLSPQTEAVMETALAVAKAFEARVCLVHAFEPPTLASGVEPYYAIDHLRDESREAFDRFIEATRSSYPGRVDGVFVESEASHALLQRLEGGDLLVVGTHGHSALMRYVLGSTAYRVVKRSEQPTLVVPMPERRFRAE
jgi:nucleotide-binding universal stress UspA family protein